MTNPIKFSVIVCTHNRCESLKYTIRSLQEQNFPASDYEIITVDNDSTDLTKRIVDQLAEESAVCLKYVFEGQLGLSRARNTGIAHAEGEIIAFIDDDAVADETWLQEFLSIYNIEDRVGCVGGRTMVRLPEGDIPKWYDNTLAGYLSGFDLGSTTYREVTDIYQYPYGVNISFKKDALLETELFNAKLGRIGNLKTSGEDIQLCLQLFKNGWRIFYNPKAVVHHYIQRDRLNKSYFIDIAKGAGITRVIWDHSGQMGICRPVNLLVYIYGLIINMAKYLLALVDGQRNPFKYYLIMTSHITSIQYGVYLKKHFRS